MNKRLLARGLIIIVLLVLLYFAFRNAPLSQIWNTLHHLQLWQIILILAIDVIIYLFITARWWLIVQAENKNISYLPMIGVRVAVFGISYFTIGPQVGGEPLQVIYLQRKYGLTYTRAASTVVMDKLLELLANFILLVFGLTGIVQAGILSKNGSPPLVSLIVLSALVAWPLISYHPPLQTNLSAIPTFANAVIHSKHKSRPLPPRLRTFGGTILPATDARFAGRDLCIHIGRHGNGKRIFSDDVFSPNPFVVLADGRGMDGRLALVSRAAARRVGCIGSESGFCVGLLRNLRRVRHQRYIGHARTRFIDRWSRIASGGTDDCQVIKINPLSIL